MTSRIPKIVIVGGGAGGLELATKLGNKLGKKKKATIVLVDENLTHLWKPLWHEVAAGTLDSHGDEINYLAQAYAHHFNFQLGSLQQLDRNKKEVYLAAVHDNKQQQIIAPRVIHYDILVIAVGSVSNDFNTPGVAEHCLFLDSRAQADYLQQVFLQAAIRTQSENSNDEVLSFAIVGGGATGVELAAELQYAAKQAANYGLAKLDPKYDIKLTIIEAAKTVLAHLPEPLIAATTNELKKRGIEILTEKRVNKVDEYGLYTTDGLFIPAKIKIWAAGIKAPDFLKQFGELETNKINQLIVRPTLQTPLDDHIFAFGDCAACPQPNTGKIVPPRAQAAHQQADFLVTAIIALLNNKPIPTYRYQDYGSLISISQQATVGNIMGNALGSFTIKGWFARMAYIWLYKLHQVALFGKWRVVLITLANMLTKSVKPRLKLH